MKRILYITLFALLFTSCIDNNDEYPNFHFTILPIEEATIPSSFVLDETYEITIKYSLPNGCHSFYCLYYEYDDANRIVAVNAIVNDEIACTEALINKEYTFEVNAAQEEDYVFKLWKGVDENDEDIFEEVIVPVTNPNSQS
ncbi:hypothetical protein ACFLRU_00675 [Bacteroidota bacterium]